MRLTLSEGKKLRLRNLAVHSKLNQYLKIAILILIVNRKISLILECNSFLLIFFRLMDVFLILKEEFSETIILLKYVSQAI